MTKEAIAHYESALKEAFPSGATGDVYHHWNEARKALEQKPTPTEFYHHVVENEGDWSDWVNPNNHSYMMKCCDCGLVHEMQFKVAKYSDGDECDFVDDPDLQPVFRARRAEEAYEAAEQREWVGLTDEEYKQLHLQMGSVYLYQDYGRAIEAKLKEKNT